MKKAAVPSILMAVVLLAGAVIAEAQQPKKVPRIGSLENTAALSAINLKPFRERYASSATLKGKTSYSSTAIGRARLSVCQTLRPS